MGRTEVMEHDLRYDRADEFMEVVLGHWDAWDDDALVVDKVSGRFADPAKVRRLDYVGQFYRSRGPFTVPRTPQGHPVVIQAGQSGRGRRFAGRWGEVIFSAAPSLELGKRGYAALREEASLAGRDPDTMRICNLVLPVCAETKTAAEDKMALVEKLPLEIDQLSLLSEALNFDFASKALDEPFTTEELASFSGLQSIRDRVLRGSGKTNPTVREFMDVSHRGRPDDAIVGGPKEVADALEEQFEGRACDGFVIAATHVPGATPTSCATSSPSYNGRGLYHTEYAGTDAAREPRPGLAGRGRLENRKSGQLELGGEPVAGGQRLQLLPGRVFDVDTRLAALLLAQVFDLARVEHAATPF